MQLGSGVAVAVVEASSCSSNSTPSLGTSIRCRYGPKSKNTEEINRKKDLCLVCCALTLTGVSVLHCVAEISPRFALLKVDFSLAGLGGNEGSS